MGGWVGGWVSLARSLPGWLDRTVARARPFDRPFARSLDRRSYVRSVLSWRPWVAFVDRPPCLPARSLGCSRRHSRAAALVLVSFTYHITLVHSEDFETDFRDHAYFSIVF